MDTIFEDVASVLSVMDQYGAGELVNANRVFEELEACHVEGDRVNHVATILLSDLGIRRRDTNSPDVIIVPDETQDRPNNGALQESVSINTHPHGAGSSNKAVVVTASVIGVIPESSSNNETEYDSHKYMISPNLAKEFQEEMEKSPVANKTEESATQSAFVPVADTVNGNHINSGAIPKSSSVFRSPSSHYSDSPSPEDTFNPSIPVINGTGVVDVVDIEEYLPTSKRNQISPSIPRKKAKMSDVEPQPEVHGQGLATNAVRISSNKVAEFVSSLSDMFPEADPQYLWQKCEKMQSEAELRDLIDQMIVTDYPRINFWKNTKGSVITFQPVSAAAGSEKSLNNLNEPGPSRSESSIVYPQVFNATSSAVSAASAMEISTETKSLPLSAKTSEMSIDVPHASAISISKEGMEVDINTVMSSTSWQVNDTKIKDCNGQEIEKTPDKPLIIVKSLQDLKAKLKSSIESDDGAVAGPSGLNEPLPPPREPWQDKLDNFKQILPDADPSYLEEKARELFNKDEESQQFILDALEKREYPTLKDWQWRQDQLALQKKYTEEFSIEGFLEMFPDPFTFFGEGKRQCDKSLGTMFLRNKYRRMRVTDISAVFSSNNFNLTSTCRKLDKWEGPFLKSRRHQVGYDVKKDREKGVDLQFLQEVAFIENESKIVEFLNGKKKAREEKFEAAKSKGELLECQCCYDSEVLFDDVRACADGHVFCLECVRRSSEQRIGEGKTSFPCLADCTAEFKLKTVQEVLKPVAFSRLVQRKQAEEVKAAGIDGLVQCPFCDFCNLLSPDDKVFKCLNTECLKRSCRECKEEDHVPLRCDEVEKSSEVKMRTYIEDQMTAALVRTCWKCSRKFVKEDGCNKMTCQCGALMCYICRQPVKDYSHFNGQGGDSFEKCPLWSTNNELHVKEIAKVAEKAKQEVLAQNPEATLKHDPTANLAAVPENAYVRALARHGQNRDPHALIRQNRQAMNEQRQRQMQRIRQAVEDFRHARLMRPNQVAAADGAVRRNHPGRREMRVAQEDRDRTARRLADLIHGVMDLAGPGPAIGAQLDALQRQAPLPAHAAAAPAPPLRGPVYYYPQRAAHAAAAPQPAPAAAPQPAPVAAPQPAPAAAPRPLCYTLQQPAPAPAAAGAAQFVQRIQYPVGAVRPVNFVYPNVALRDRLHNFVDPNEAIIRNALHNQPYQQPPPYDVIPADVPMYPPNPAQANQHPHAHNPFY